MEYKLTEHVKQRYAERIMDKSDNVQSFIATHQEKIYTDIEKMVDYGKTLYLGASVVDYNKAVVQVILNGHWVIICDPKQGKVVTLFEIDLGLGKEFNDNYISKLLEKLETAKEEFNEENDRLEEQDKTYAEQIKQNEEQINQYKGFIKSLVEQNNMLEGLRQELKQNKNMAEQNVRDIVAVFCGKKVF